MKNIDGATGTKTGAGPWNFTKPGEFMDDLMTPPSVEPLVEEVSVKHRARIMIGLLFLLLLMGCLLAIASGKLQIEQVISESMEPTLLVGDTLLVDGNALPNRYDVVCLADPENPEDKLVKRIMGIPGDEIRIVSGVIYINGKEEYSEQIRGNSISWPNVKVVVPANNVFVLGDNRNNSHDSLNFGPVPYKLIRGVVTMIIWPKKRMSRIKPLHGEQS